MLKKSYFHGDTKHIFFIFINALESAVRTDRALNRHDSSTGNDVTTSSSEHSPSSSSLQFRTDGRFTR